MKKSWFAVILFVIAVNLFGCGRATQTSSQSTFKASFSMNAVVENNKRFLQEEARNSSRAESGLSEPFLQSHEELVIQIDPNNVPEFMVAVRSDIEQAIVDNDARILGSEGGSNETGHFSFNYSENAIHGSIHVWGIPGGDANFTPIVLITES